MATHSSILAWEKSHGRRSLVGYSPWGHSRTQMSDLAAAAAATIVHKTYVLQKCSPSL